MADARGASEREGDGTSDAEAMLGEDDLGLEPRGVDSPRVGDERGAAEPVDGAIDVDDREHAIVTEQRSRQLRVAPKWFFAAGLMFGTAPIGRHAVDRSTRLDASAVEGMQRSWLSRSARRLRFLVTAGGMHELYRSA